jgi:hypothetical protein
MHSSSHRPVPEWSSHLPNTQRLTTGNELDVSDAQIVERSCNRLHRKGGKSWNGRILQLIARKERKKRKGRILPGLGRVLARRRQPRNKKKKSF